MNCTANKNHKNYIEKKKEKSDEKRIKHANKFVHIQQHRTAHSATTIEQTIFKNKNKTVTIPLAAFGAIVTDKSPNTPGIIASNNNL